MDLKSYLEKSINRLNKLRELFSEKEISIVCDKLRNEHKTDFDVLYYRIGSHKLKNSNLKNHKDEEELLFIFGYDFFIKELKYQEFKRLVNQNHLDFVIFKAYHNLKKEKKNNEKIKISEIIDNIQETEKDSIELHKIIEKLLTQSFYLGWNLKKVSNSIENDYYIDIPEKFLIKVKQRFNLDIIENIFENENLFIFLNGKGKLILVLKDREVFSGKDIEKYIVPVLEELLKLKINHC